MQVAEILYRTYRNAQLVSYVSSISEQQTQSSPVSTEVFEIHSGRYSWHTNQALRALQQSQLLLAPTKPPSPIPETMFYFNI